MSQEYACIEGFSNYRVYRDGKIINVNNGNPMRVHDDGKNGYLKVKLTDDTGKRIHFWLSRLVYTAFYGNIPKGFEVDHIDGDRLNNCLDNLSMVTHKQNQTLKKQRDSRTLFNRKYQKKCRKNELCIV